MNELEMKVAQIQSLAFEEIMCKKKKKRLYNLRQVQMTDGNNQ